MWTTAAPASRPAQTRRRAPQRPPRALAVRLAPQPACLAKGNPNPVSPDPRQRSGSATPSEKQLRPAARWAAACVRSPRVGSTASEVRRTQPVAVRRWNLSTSSGLPRRCLYSPFCAGQGHPQPWARRDRVGPPGMALRTSLEWRRELHPAHCPIQTRRPAGGGLHGSAQIKHHPRLPRASRDNPLAKPTSNPARVTIILEAAYAYLSRLGAQICQNS